MQLGKLKIPIGGAPASTTDAATSHPPSDATEDWIRFGSKVVAALVVSVLALSLLFKISGAVVASGTVTVQGNYRTVQHADGGIVKAILVKDGDKVTKGQVLVELDATSAAANLAITQGRIDELLIQRARLKAERDGAETYSLPATIRTRAMTPALKNVIASQSALFDARTKSRQSERDVLKQQVTQLADQRRGIRAQLTAREREAKIAAKDLTAVRRLYERGYASRQRYTAVERDAARLSGDLGRLQGELARITNARAEALLRLDQAEKNATQNVVNELRQVNTQLNEFEQQRKTQTARSNRVEIRAPVTGFVHALAIHTVGGVIRPGSALVQIIPIGQPLLVEARIKTADIDKVREGLPTKVRFPAFNSRLTPALEGSVSRISPAQLTDPQGHEYFSVKVTLLPGEEKRIGGSGRLVPGMPAEVFIETASRSIMSYFLKPLSDAMTHSMREQ